MTEDEMKSTRPCKGCGMPITIATQADGKPIPLDRRSPVYRFEKDLVGQWVAVRDTTAFVSHFASCPKAADFSASNKNRGGGGG